MLLGTVTVGSSTRRYVRLISINIHIFHMKVDYILRALRARLRIVVDAIS